MNIFLGAITYIVNITKPDSKIAITGILQTNINSCDAHLQ